MTFQEFMKKVEAKNPGEPEFIQAVSEVVESIWMSMKAILVL